MNLSLVVEENGPREMSSKALPPSEAAGREHNRSHRARVHISTQACAPRTRSEGAKASDGSGQSPREERVQRDTHSSLDRQHCDCRCNTSQDVNRDLRGLCASADRARAAATCLASVCAQALGSRLSRNEARSAWAGSLVADVSRLFVLLNLQELEAQDHAPRVGWLP